MFRAEFPETDAIDPSLDDPYFHAFKRFKVLVVIALIIHAHIQGSIDAAHGLGYKQDLI